MIKQVFVSTAVAALLATGLTVTGPAEAHQAGAHRNKAPAISAPASGMTQRAFKIRVRPRAAHAKVVLQRKVGKAWKPVARKRVRHARPVTFTRVERRAGTVAFRAKVGHKVSRVDRIRIRQRQRPATPPPVKPPPVKPPPVKPPPAAPELLMSVNADTEDVFVTDFYAVSGLMLKGSTPLVGRSVVVEKQVLGATAWTSLGTFTTDDNGGFAFQDSSAQRGLVEYRGTSGSLSGSTILAVSEVLDMPSEAGNEFSLRAQGCDAGVSGSTSQVDLTLTSTPAEPGQPPKPACQVQSGDFVQTTWKLTGECSMFRFDNVVLNGPANVRAQVGVSVGDIQIEEWDLGQGDGTGRFVLNGDPDTVVIRMQITQGSGGDVLGAIEEPEAICI